MIIGMNQLKHLYRDIIPRLSSQTKWPIIMLVLVVIVVPSSWMAVQDLHTTERLMNAVERGMQQDAMLFADMLVEYTEQVLDEDSNKDKVHNLTRSLDGHSRIEPAVMRTSVIPEAFSRFARDVEARRGTKSFPGGIIRFEIQMPDTTLVLSRITHTLAANHPDAIDTYTRTFDLGGLYPGWNVRVACFNEMKATRWRRYLASIFPLLLLIGGVFFTTRMALREIDLSQAKSTFVSNVSHELKTPLAKIRFFNELLKDLPHDAREKQLKYHNVINQECERLAILIDNVLDFNRIERGQMTYRIMRMPIGEVLTEIVDTFNLLHGARGFHIKLYAPSPSPVLSIDAAMIRQALINLLDNAVKYSDPHTVEVHAERISHDGRPSFAITVEDQGIGIPADQTDRIFSEFYRVDSGPSQRISGSGLGLALVRHIAEAHGGSVQVHSVEDHGSTFTLILPMEGISSPQLLA